MSGTSRVPMDFRNEQMIRDGCGNKSKDGRCLEDVEMVKGKIRSAIAERREVSVRRRTDEKRWSVLVNGVVYSVRRVDMVECGFRIHILQSRIEDWRAIDFKVDLLF